MLPNPPPPRPARRDATIDMALRRFDGAPDPVGQSPKPERPSWVGGVRQRPVGLIASVLIVAAIGIPATLIGLRDQPSEVIQEPSAVPMPVPVSEPKANADKAPVEVAPPQTPSLVSAPSSAKQLPPVLVAPQARQESVDRRERAADSAARDVAAPAPAFAAAGAPPPPPPPAAPATVLRSQEMARQNANDVADATAVGEVVVTASRRQPEVVAKSVSGMAEGSDVRSATDYFKRAISRQRHGDWRGALADLDRAHRLEPRNPLILRQRIVVQRELGKFRRAEQDEARLRELGAP